ncbi:MAG: hypothetical protein KDI68_14060 [Gammaproteobacteria bacterium]|nr:hypothetical protein [Gammaproteobacteria bacterium]
MNIRAIVSGALLQVLVALVMLFILRLSADGGVGAPRLLTLSALLSVAGFHAARQCREAGLLHGMLAGLLGGALLAVAVALTPRDQSGAALLQVAADKRTILLLVICGLWGATGGLFADIARAAHARRAQRRSMRRQEPDG